MIEMITSTNDLNFELEANLNTLLDNYLGYVENGLLEAEIMDFNKQLV